MKWRKSGRPYPGRKGKPKSKNIPIYKQKNMYVSEGSLCYVLRPETILVLSRSVYIISAVFPKSKVNQDKR